MKYFEHYSEWAVSHSGLSRLGKLFKNEMSQNSGKSPKRGEEAAPTIKSPDYFEMRGS